jgi:hypothetical protein
MSTKNMYVYFDFSFFLLMLCYDIVILFILTDKNVIKTWKELSSQQATSKVVGGMIKSFH